MSFTEDQIIGLELMEKGIKILIEEGYSNEKILRDLEAIEDLIAGTRGHRSIRSRHYDKYGLKYALESGQDVRLYNRNDQFAGDRLEAIEEGKKLEAESDNGVKFIYDDLNGMTIFRFE